MKKRRKRKKDTFIKTIAFRMNGEDFNSLKKSAIKRRTSMAFILRDLIYKHLQN